MARGDAPPEAEAPTLVRDAEWGRVRRGFHPVRLQTRRGVVALRYFPAPGADAAAAFVGGVGGGWDSPARGLYKRLARDLTGEGVAGLRVRYRRPTDLAECVHDTLASLEFLRHEGAGRKAVVGHSLGGAVAIQAAARDATVRACVTLATQSHGAGDAAQLGPRCALLLIHGMGDRVLPAACTEQVAQWARQPKRLVIHPGAGHGLDSVAGEVYGEVRGWLVEHLAG